MATEPALQECEEMSLPLVHTRNPLPKSDDHVRARFMSEVGPSWQVFRKVVDCLHHIITTRQAVAFRHIADAIDYEGVRGDDRIPEYTARIYYLIVKDLCEIAPDFRGDIDEEVIAFFHGKAKKSEGRIYYTICNEQRLDRIERSKNCLRSFLFRRGIISEANRQSSGASIPTFEPSGHAAHLGHLDEATHVGTEVTEQSFDETERSAYSSNDSSQQGDGPSRPPQGDLFDAVSGQDQYIERCSNLSAPPGMKPDGFLSDQVQEHRPELESPLIPDSEDVSPTSANITGPLYGTVATPREDNPDQEPEADPPHKDHPVPTGGQEGKATGLRQTRAQNWISVTKTALVFACVLSISVIILLWEAGKLAWNTTA